MALKGQKFKRYTDEQRAVIVNEYLNERCGYKYIAKKYNISWKTVESMVRKYRRTGTTIRNSPPGRSKNESDLTKEDWKERYEILKKYQAFIRAQRERK